MIQNSDLYKNLYDIDILIENIENLNLNVILKTQKLTIPFCVEYILNSKYQMEQDEKYIGIDEIENTQPHINRNELIRYFLDPNT